MSAQSTEIDLTRWHQKWALAAPSDLVAPSFLSEPVARRVTSAFRMPVWVFVADGARVVSRLPVEVEVSQEGPDEDCQSSSYVFRCKGLHVFAAGESYVDAENSFHEQVVHFFRTYTQLPSDGVAPDAAEIQKIYKANFAEEKSAAAQ